MCHHRQSKPPPANAAAASLAPEQLKAKIWATSRNIKSSSNSTKYYFKILEGNLVICERCKSKSHQECFSSKPNPCDSKFCSSCIDPERLIFAPMELRKPKGVKVMNVDASLLLLTAAKIGCMVVCGAWEAKKYYAVVQLYEAVVDRKKATLGVNRAMKDADLKNKNMNVESSFDSSETDMDTDTDTDDDVGRMQKLTIEGGDAFDLNKECTQGG
ncbi:hypothetical protein LXL04_039080 [Taraxacum kok-saghyz]